MLLLRFLIIHTFSNKLKQLSLYNDFQISICYKHQYVAMTTYCWISICFVIHFYIRINLNEYLYLLYKKQQQHYIHL